MSQDVNNLLVKIASLEEEKNNLAANREQFIDLTILQRSINEKNRQTLASLVSILESLPVSDETQKLITALVKDFRKMGYSKISEIKND